jgi:GDP-4-dehydro-6-deoxy-D-mannose reductase
MRILITGATGFAGGHLAGALAARGHQLHGVSRHAAWPDAWKHLAGSVRLHAADLTDSPAVEAVLRAVEPEQVYHLAGYADAGRSFREPDLAWAGNLTATLALYEAVRRWGGKTRVLFVSSGLIYGEPEEPGRACDERTPMRPASPYAASKAAADLASYQATRFPGLDVVRVRPFNHIGPRQSPQFAVANFARQIAAIERGELTPVLETGDLSARRDLTDVRDMVEAYILLMEKGRTGEAYNAGQGETQTIRTVLDRLVAQSRHKPIEVRPRPGLSRPADTAVTVADAGKLRRETGWQPRHSLDQTLADILNYWREQGRDDSTEGRIA